MNSLGVASIVLVCVLAGAALGSIAGKKLPPHHMSDATKDIVKFGAGFIATMAALVLGLLVASAKTSYDAKAAEIEQAAAKIILLDQALRHYGPEAKPARDTLRAALIAGHSMTWMKSEAAAASRTADSARGAAPPANAIRESVAGLAPVNDTQHAAQTYALQTIDDFMQMRWLFVAQSTERVSTPLLVVLIAWLTTIAFCTGLHSPRNATAAAVALLCGVSVSGAVFLVVEMYEPFDGIMRISDEPLRAALAYIGR